ncbi:MAG: FkbM family methyltransferase [Bacteroidota bacterium]
MTTATLLQNLAKVDQLAKASKLRRALHAPWRYLSAIAYREWQYRRQQQHIAVTATTFFGQTMHLLLPASTDIYLTGGKTHHSEIRLARFLIQQLQPGDTCIDVGAHYGYFSLLAAHLVGSTGRVAAYEAAPTTYEVLAKNAAPLPQLTAHHRAVSNAAETLTFYQFPNLYSEYNTLDVAQFEQEAWFKTAPPQIVNVTAIVLDEVVQKEQLRPQLIKIDVEGAELQVIEGLRQTLAQQQPTLVMEYLCDERGNAAHRAAEQLLRTLGYQAHRIQENGSSILVNNVPHYLRAAQLESDNVVFKTRE